VTEALKSFLDSRLADITKVVLPNGSVLAFVNLANVKHSLEIAAILITIIYTIWRWRRDAGKK
jgi:hypothetical protein